jgi:hypothetical protein
MGIVRPDREARREKPLRRVCPVATVSDRRHLQTPAVRDRRYSLDRRVGLLTT